MLITDIVMLDKSKIFNRDVSIDTAGIFFETDLFRNKKVNYFWTKDAIYLKQYMQSTDVLIEKETGVRRSYKSIFDNLTETMFFVGAIENEFVGGTRVLVSNPYTEKSLPSESEEFNYNLLFPELDLSSYKYCEISKFAIRKKFRSNYDHYKIFFTELVKMVRELNVRYLFFYSTPARARLYKRLVGEYFDFVSEKLCDFSGWEGFETANEINKVSVLSYQARDIF